VLPRPAGCRRLVCDALPAHSDAVGTHAAAGRDHHTAVLHTVTLSLMLISSNRTLSPCRLLTACPRCPPSTQPATQWAQEQQQAGTIAHAYCANSPLTLNPFLCVFLCVRTPLPAGCRWPVSDALPPHSQRRSRHRRSSRQGQSHTFLHQITLLLLVLILLLCVRTPLPCRLLTACS
jgi:hypothetical protein